MHNLCLNLTDECNLRCSYCLSAGTKILLSDGNIKNIEDIKTGDVVMGCDEYTSHRKQKKIFPTKVIETYQKTETEYLKITMQDGKILKITNNHPVLNGRGKWTEAKNLKEKTGIIMSLGYFPTDKEEDILNNKNYIIGYFLAMWLTDGSFKEYTYNGTKQYRMRLAVKDDEIIQRMKKYCDLLNFNYTTRLFLISSKFNLKKEAIFSNQKQNYYFITNLLQEVKDNKNNIQDNFDFLMGFIAACYDAEGHIDKKGYVVSIANSDNFILDLWEKGLSKLNILTCRDKGKKQKNLLVYRSRMLTKNYQIATGELQMKFFDNAKPAVTRKTYLAFHNSSPLYRNYIENIETVYENITVYNFATESHTYIANGLVVHNCFCIKQPHYMTLQVAKDAVDFLLKECPDKKPSITFFGGEPTLCWDSIIVPLVEYANGRINFDITTNGTLLNKERIQFLKDNNIQILLSIDGGKEAQEATRPCANGDSSYELLKDNIPLILNAFPQTTFRATISTENVKYLFDSFKYALYNNFKGIFFAINAREHWSEENMKILEKELNNIHFYIASYIIENQKEFPVYVNLWNKYIGEICAVLGHADFRPSAAHCGLGTTTAAVGWDGKLYGCQEAVSLGPDNNIFYIGDIYHGYDSSKLVEAWLAPHPLPYPECQNCARQKICQTNSCPSVNYEIENKLYIPTKTSCKFDSINFKQCNMYLKMIESILGEKGEK